MNKAPELFYAVLHHEGIDEPHFDLLIERSRKGRVPTWRLPQWPIEGRTPAVRLSDHRRIYLNYSGPVSGKRGVVRTVEFGTHRTKRDRVYWRVEFVRRHTVMGLELKRVRGKEWEVTPITYRKGA